MTKTHHTLASLCVLVGVLALCAAPALATEPIENCPNAQRRAEQPLALALPDCRAYEMVSPLEKNGKGVSFVDSRASVSGEALAYLAPGSFANPQSAGLESRYIARRSANGWSTQNVSPSYTDYEAFPSHNPPFGESLFNADLSSGILTSMFTPLVSGEPAGYINLYVANTGAGSYQTVTDVIPTKEYKPFTEPIYEGPQPEGASVDLRRVVLQQLASLCCGASPGRHSHIYEWEDGKLSLVDVAPEGAKFEADDDVGSAPNFDHPSAEGNPWRAVSGDGLRVFFTAGEGEPTSVEGQLYVRENPTSTVSGCGVPGGACTVEVSASQRSVPDLNGPQPAFYRDASVSGSRVFFTSRAELTTDANTGKKDNAGNLYEYDLETGVLSDLTVDLGAPDGAAVVGLVTASEDGSYVYFVANGMLATGAEKEGNCKIEFDESGIAGERTCNLYVEHDGLGGWEPPKFIATLAGTNFNQFTENLENTNSDEADWIGDEVDDDDFGPGRHTARVSGDGMLLAFQSELSLTGYDNETAEVGACGESGRCREVYLYDAVTGKLVCVSCDPSGARPIGPAELGGDEVEVGSITQVEPFYLARNLSEDDKRLFFQSPDALVPHDSNGLLDVYEWERPASAAEAERGENNCTLASPDYHAEQEGCVVAISDVAGDQKSHFMDASPSGNDVFIATADQLAPSDTDTRQDVYDVRVGGGFPASAPAPVCVNADSCKPPVSSQPGVFGAPASATFSGPGNPAAPSPPAAVKPSKSTVKCREPKKLTRGKCLEPKKKTKKTKKARRTGNYRRAHR